MRTVVLVVALAGCAKAQAGAGPSTLESPQLDQVGEVEPDVDRLDRDDDGVLDTDDTCPREAEDLDGDRDADGCPEAGDPPPPVPSTP